MEFKEEAGKLDVVVFIVVLLGSAYFLTTGYPLYLSDRFPFLENVFLKVSASASIGVGILYLVYVVVASFLHSVKRLDTVLNIREEEEGKG